MAETKTYKAPTLGGPIAAKKAQSAREQDALTGEQVVAEVMRAYRANDALAAENRELRGKMDALEGGVGEKLRRIGMRALEEMVRFDCSALARDFGASEDDAAILDFETWCSFAVERVPDDLSALEMRELLGMKLVAAYQRRMSIAERAVERENGREK